jgi:hypothetical protein
MSTYKGTIRINGKKYKVEVVNGQRYIDGMTVEAFVDQLDKITQIELAEVGQQAIIDEKKGTKNGGYQKMMDRNHIIKSN